MIIRGIIFAAPGYYNINLFSRYLNSANGRFSVFRDFIFTNGSAKSSALQRVVRFFRGVKFHE